MRVKKSGFIFAFPLEWMWFIFFVNLQLYKLFEEYQGDMTQL